MTLKTATSNISFEQLNTTTKFKEIKYLGFLDENVVEDFEKKQYDIQSLGILQSVSLLWRSHTHICTSAHTHTQKNEPD